MRFLRRDPKKYHEIFRTEREILSSIKSDNIITCEDLAKKLGMSLIGIKKSLKQPVRTAFDTVSKRNNLLLSWVEDTDKFLRDFTEDKREEMLWSGVVLGISE